jgi:hypothetical protein
MMHDLIVNCRRANREQAHLWGSKTRDLGAEKRALAKEELKLEIAAREVI